MSLRKNETWDGWQELLCFCNCMRDNLSPFRCPWGERKQEGTDTGWKSPQVSKLRTIGGQGSPENGFGGWEGFTLFFHLRIFLYLEQNPESDSSSFLIWTPKELRVPVRKHCWANTHWAGASHPLHEAPPSARCIPPLLEGVEAPQQVL